MSKIIINYSDINSASRKAKAVSDYYEDMANDIQRKIIRKLSGLDGADSEGNVETARCLLASKVTILQKKETQFLDLSKSIKKLGENIKDHESDVVSNIRSTATEALELKNQGAWKSITQWAYGTFCVDLVNSNSFTRGIGNGVKEGLDWVQEQETKVENWFKRGGGQYVIDAAKDILALGGAVVATAGAVALVVGTGGTAGVLLVVAAGASGVGTALTLGDTATSLWNKKKAMDIYNDTGDPGKARYYAGIDGVKDALGKYDVGGATANKVAGAAGTGYDALHTAADVTALLAGAGAKAGLSGTRVTNPTTGKVELRTTYDPAKVKDNFPNLVREQMGFRNEAGKWTFDVKNLFSTKDPVSGATAKADVLIKNAQKDALGPGMYNAMETTQKIIDFPSKAYDAVDNFNQVFSSDSSGYDRVKGALGIVGGTDMHISSPVSNFNDTILKIVDTAVDSAS